MSITSVIFNQISKGRLKLLDKSRVTPEIFQANWFKKLISSGSETSFGKEHSFGQINSIGDYQRLVPLRDYDALEPYIERLRTGEDYVLWNKKVRWFAKSSGTSSSKSKFIPITAESLEQCHLEGMRTLLASYIDQTPNSQLFDGKALTLGGSATVDEKGNGNSQYGDLSAILLKNSPPWAELRRVPKKSIALIPDFEEKIEKICRCVSNQNITSFSGVPSWNLVLMNKILEYTGKGDLTQVWPNLELFMHGGINFEPYRESYKKIIPKPQMNYRENYNASEGYFGFQDDPADNSLLLLVNNGIFYEFIPTERLTEALEGSFTAFETIESVQTGVNYAIVLTTNGGLWRYLLGDCVMFTSLKPHKILIVGRTQLYINAFGEELMINNAERALAKTCSEAGVVVSNYTVAPLFMEGTQKGSHQWVVEFSQPPRNLEDFADLLDKNICLFNSDYEAKRSKNATMKRLTITPVTKGVFYQWMSERGKLGGQNKVPRLYSKRDYVEQLLAIEKGQGAIDLDRIFHLTSREQFASVSLEIFRYQAEHCEPYKRYLSLLNTDINKINSITDIPFFPIQFFKSETVISGTTPAQKIFTSSATTGMIPSSHHVADLSIYEKSFSKGFALQYGNPADYAILALLPSYLEREGSSLVYMTEGLMKQSGNPNNGYYLYNHKELYEVLCRLKAASQKTILIGVSFALLDFIANYKIDFPTLIVMETGGMKGRGEELTREELHRRLKYGFGVDQVHSEYGMAELLSQAYSKGNGLFCAPPWMGIIIRDLNNPFRVLPTGKRGGVNIVDLANINSCSFIETEDLGIKETEDGFKILGRIQTSELRGCNLLLD